MKTFYLARIREAANTRERFAVPKEFDPARHFGDSIGIYVGDAPFRFRVRIGREAAAWAAEVRWHPGQKLKTVAGGEVELELPAGSLWEARRFVLSFGKNAVALSPPRLVEDLKGEIGAMSAAY